MTEPQTHTFWTNPSSSQPPAEDTGILRLPGVNVENAITSAILIGSIAVGAIVLAPELLQSHGWGTEIGKALDAECCTIVGIDTGIAGTLSQLIESIPSIGEYLNTAGGENLLAPAVVGGGGYAIGALLSRFEKAVGGSGKIGTGVRVASMGLGAVLAMPAILPAVGHGVQFISRGIGVEETGNVIAKLIGNTDVCMSEAIANGVKGGTSMLLGHMPCIMPMVLASYPMAAGTALSAANMHADHSHAARR